MSPERQVFSRRKILGGVVIASSIVSAIASFDSRRRTMGAGSEVVDLSADAKKFTEVAKETSDTLTLLEKNQQTLDEEAIEGVLADISNLKNLKEGISSDIQSTRNNIRIAKIEKKVALGALMVAAPAFLASAYYFVKGLRRP